MIVKLYYLKKGSRFYIEYIVHQCARGTYVPKKYHVQVLRWLGRYLKGTRDKGTILNPKMVKNIEVYVDAYFSGNWYQHDSLERGTKQSRYGYIIMYTRCPLVCKSQLQTGITLSSTDSEYTGFSYALRKVISIV